LPPDFRHGTPEKEENFLQLYKYQTLIFLPKKVCGSQVDEIISKTEGELVVPDFVPEMEV